MIPGRRRADPPRPDPDLPGPQTHGRGAYLPALLTLLAGVLVLLVRPPLPIDETRYLEVLRESFHDNPWLLMLEGHPYAEKPPLMFWLARMVSLLGPSGETCLRLVPAVASATLVFVVGRMGRRLGIPAAGWIQATLLLPFLYSQYLLFDPLLAATVWLAIEAWSRKRGVSATAASSLAFLAKGPVAAIFLVLLFWAFSPLRPPGKRTWARALAVLVLGLVPLVVWALLAAHAGGEAFARDLLWDRWAGRVDSSFAHARPLYFYVPLLFLGALPCSLLAFARGREGALHAVLDRRLAWALLLILLVFSGMSGKQPHYLLPLAPVLALWLGERMTGTRRAERLLRAGAGLLFALFLGVLVTAFVVREPYAATFGDPGAKLARSWLWRGLLIAAGLVVLGGLASLLRRRPVPLGVLPLVFLVEVAVALPTHFAAARLAFPHGLQQALAEMPAGTPLALLGGRKGGLYNWLTSRDRIDRVGSAEEVAAWTAGNPGGFLIVDDDERERLPATGLMPVLTYRVRGHAGVLLRVVGED